MFKWNETRLVFLQVPGFKELQAFLHRQAFLQTLGGDESRRERPLTAQPAPWARLQSGRGAGAGVRVGQEGLLERLVGHAKERAVPCEMVLSG